MPLDASDAVIDQQESSTVAPVALLVVSGDSDVEAARSAATELTHIGYRTETLPVPSPAFDRLLADGDCLIDVIVAFGATALRGCRPLSARHEYAARVLAVDDPAPSPTALRHAVRLADAVVAPEPLAAMIADVALRPPLVSRVVGEAPSLRPWSDAVAVAATNRTRVLERAGW